VGPLGCANFHLNRHRGWECRSGGVKQGLVGENSQFSANISQYLGNGTRQTDLLRNVNMKSMYSIDPCQFLRPRVTLKGKTQGVQFFRRMFIHTLVYHNTISPKAIEFGIVNVTRVRHDCSGVTSIGQGRTNARGLRGLGGPSLTLNFN